jgi:hypothetical protein
VPRVWQDIKGRAARKQQLLDEADSARSSANSQRRVERELFNGLRRDKVDSIQKMQVGGRGGVSMCKMSLCV